MESYSDETAQEIEDRVSAWIDEFEKSQEYLGLSSDQQEESSFAIGVFANLMYGYYLETPGEWSANALDTCCVSLLPRKVLAGPEFYAAVEPVFSAFFAFLQRKGYISNAAELTKRLKKVAGRMIKAAERPDSWGLAKTFLARAIEDGVDVSDEEEIQKYVDKTNEQARRSASDPIEGKRPPAGR